MAVSGLASRRAAAVAAGALAAGALAVTLATALAEAAGGGARTVELTIRHSRFVPASFTVERGATVRFVIRNTDPIDHEFILGGPAVQQRHEEGTERSHGAVPGEASIPAGTTATTSYAFGERGTVLIGCHLPGHWDYGMRASVRVL